MLLAYILTLFAFDFYPGVSFATLFRNITLSNSRKVAFFCAFGIATADGISAVLASAGIDILLKLHDSVFFVIRVLGTLYLIYIAISMLRADKSSVEIAKKKFISIKKSFHQGFACTFSNPSVIITIAAIMGQHIGTDISICRRILMTTCVPLVSFLTYSIWVVLFGFKTFRPFIERNRYILNRVSCVAIFVFIAMDLPDILKLIKGL